MVPASEGLGVAGPSGSRRNPERAVSLPTGKSTARPHRQGIIEEGLEIECATEKLKSKLEQLKGNLSELLEDFRKSDLTSIPDDRIRSILSTVILQAPCSVSCARCPQFRPVYPIQFERIGTAQRLFAICILIGDPFLICLLLSKGLDDAKFGACKSEADLIRDAATSPNTAKALFDLKDSFFRISVATYIRCSRRDNDRPQNTERNFVMDELLVLMGKLEVRARAGRNGTQTSIRIGELTFGKSSPMMYERPVGRCPRIWDGEVSIQALGSLLLDVIWFLIGGSQTVLRLDKYRYRDTWKADWVKLTPAEEMQRLKSEPKLEKAFELAWIMVQPRGHFGLSGIDVDDYHWAVVHFHQIWPQVDFDNIEDPGPSRSPDAMSVSTRNFGADRFSTFEPYEEIDTPELRWLFLRCWKERREETPCRLRIYRARSGLRIRFDIYTIEKRPVEHKEYYARLDGLKFIPLYAYTTTAGDFSAKLLPRSGSARDIDIKHSFRFRSRADVRIFQEALTGRKIEADAKLEKITLDVRREHEIRVGKMKVGSKWGGVEEIPRDSGTIQLWRVLEKDDLEYVHKRGLHLPHGTKDYPLRLEIAIFSEDMFIIIGVTSLLKVREWGKAGYGLSIMSKDTTSSSMLMGREYIVESQDDEKIYPGLPLFQKSPFELPPDGKKVCCQTLALRFASAADRAEIRDILTGNYNASLVGG